jgi:hypothetical protein
MSFSGWTTVGSHDDPVIFTIEQLSEATYAWSQGGDTSLVDKQQLTQLLRQAIQGGTHDLGGGNVGRA